MSSDKNNPSGEFEPSPTSAPPSDVVIPVESIYGDNVPIAPPELKEKDQEVEGDRPHANIQSQVSQGGGTSIKIGFIPFLILLMAIGAGLFVLGNKYRVDFKDGTPTIEQTLPSTTENTPIESTKIETDSPKQKRSLNFLRDLGLYKRENSVTAPELAGNRLRLAKKTIIWVTSEPNNEKMLDVLTAIKNQSPIPIFIVTGAETSAARTRRAVDSGFTVSKISSSLEIPYSILLIDDRILMDISREHWIWETTDKEIISQTARWANELLKTSKIIDDRIQ
jgi:hypothetical protein